MLRLLNHLRFIPLVACAYIQIGLFSFLVIWLNIFLDRLVVREEKEI